MAHRSDLDLVNETTSTTGTGTLTLSGAVPGFVGVCHATLGLLADGDTGWFVARNGTEWEEFLGTRGGAGTTLARTTRIKSSTGAAVNFTSPPVVYGVVPGTVLMTSLNTREKLTEARTYYVRTDGSDSNTGLVNSAGGAFLTIQSAVNAASGLDLGSFDVTINVGDGTYTGSVTLKPYLTCGGSIFISGNAATPENVHVSTTSADCFVGTDAGKYTVSNLKATTTTSGNCLLAAGRTTLNFGNIVFGACAEAQMYATNGANIRCLSSYSIVGSAVYHLRALQGGIIEIYGVTITITGTPAFSGAFAHCSRLSLYNTISVTYSGSATGKRYNAELNSVVNTYGSATTFLPGDVTGTTATGGQYA